MDLYFCDECGTRVSDLDLRGGKGMRQSNDVICSGCVDQGRAADWMSRTGHAVAHGAAPAAAPADIISVARDRASTMPDDPFAAAAVEEPAPLPASPVAVPAHETDSIPSKPTPPSDGFAAAAGGFDALAEATPSAEDGKDDLADRAEGDATDTDTEAGPADHPGKAVTEEVAVRREDKPSKTTSGRQASSKRSSTTTAKRPTTKTTRRVASPLASKKVMLYSLLSCAVMVVVFFTVVLPNVNRPRAREGVRITEEPLRDLQKRVDEAKELCGAALQTTDRAVVQKAIDAIHRMDASFETFREAANKENWKEDNYAVELNRIGFNDVKSMSKGVRDSWVRLEQQK